MQATKQHLRVVASRPAANAPLVRPEYVPNGYTEVERPGAPADDLLNALLGLLYLGLGAVCVLGSLYCFALFMFSLSRIA